MSDSAKTKLSCSRCRKKKIFIDLCKCLQYFCRDCSPYYVHGCKFDWKKRNQDILAEKNPQIIGIKVESI